MAQQQQQQQFRLRVLYSKQGRLVMLSHLEVAESLRRGVRRADLPFAVSQGFSPHMKMTFSAALPVGVGSTCEIFDLWLTRYVDPKEALAALQSGSVPDLMVTDCAYVENKAKAASVAFPFGHYEAVFDGDASGLVLPESITVVREGKKPKTQVVEDYLRGAFEIEGNRARFVLEAMPKGSLRPDNLLKATLEDYNAQAQTPLSLMSCTRVDQKDETGQSITIM